MNFLGNQIDHQECTVYKEKDLRKWEANN